MERAPGWCASFMPRAPSPTMPVSMRASTVAPLKSAQGDRSVRNDNAALHTFHHLSRGHFARAGAVRQTVRPNEVVDGSLVGWQTPLREEI